MEVRFLASCLAWPQTGHAVLAGVDEGLFASAGTREAFRRVKARLEAQSAGNVVQEGEKADIAGGGDEAFAEVVLRSGNERFSTAVTQELFLRLQEAQVSRLIARLKQEGPDVRGLQNEELVRLYAVRRRLRDAIRATPIDDEPDEG
jgi:hypothetical protein